MNFLEKNRSGKGRDHRFFYNERFIYLFLLIVTLVSVYFFLIFFKIQFNGFSFYYVFLLTISFLLSLTPEKHQDQNRSQD